MGNPKIKNQINLKKQPFRGIYAEIAKEIAVSPQAVRQAVVLHRNPRIMTLVANKIQERKDAVRRLDRAIAG